MAWHEIRSLMGWISLDPVANQTSAKRTNIYDNDDKIPSNIDQSALKETKLHERWKHNNK
eukprot:scaffold2802_cov127-Skeletonema_dohrnii-CCMP3373.AAC.7